MANRGVVAIQPACAYCQAPANSEEEAVPRWAARELRRLGYSRYFSHSGGSNNPGKWVRAIRQTAAHTAYKVVCRRCNNGWMSQLEDAASEILKQTLGSLRAVSMSAEQAETLVAWTANRAIISDYARNPAGPFFSESQRHDFAKSLKPPAGFHLWLAASTVRANQCRSSTAANCEVSASDRRVKILLTVYQLGHFIFDSICMAWEDGSVRDPPPVVTEPQEWKLYTCQVQPRAAGMYPLVWPPPWTLDDRPTYRNYCYRWHPRGSKPLAGDPMFDA